MNSNREEPLWRLIAYWGVIISFFSLPLVAMIIHLTVLFEHLTKDVYRDQFSYLWTFHKVLAAMLAAMLGLNSWDRHAVMKNGNN